MTTSATELATTRMLQPIRPARLALSDPSSSSITFQVQLGVQASVLCHSLEAEGNNLQVVPAEKADMVTTADQNESYISSNNWMVQAESRNLTPWRTVPDRYYPSLKSYMNDGCYERDMEEKMEQILSYASEIVVAGDEKDAWVLDVDDTCISNLPYYKQKRYGCDPFDSAMFKDWILKGECPANDAVLGLFRKLIARGFKVFLLTGRRKDAEVFLEQATRRNLHNAGFIDYERLIMRSAAYKGQKTLRYKSEMRKQIEEQGYRIWGNVGDQWSDLEGECIGKRTFKLPNPMYFIP